MNTISRKNTLFGTLFLGPELFWNGVNELKDICLYNDHSLAANQFLHVAFHLIGIIGNNDLKLMNVGSKQWNLRALGIDKDNLMGFFAEFFNNDNFNLAGKSNQCLLVKIREKEEKFTNYTDKKKEKDPSTGHAIIYGEKDPVSDKVTLYACEVYDFLAHHPRYYRQDYHFYITHCEHSKDSNLDNNYAYSSQIVDCHDEPVDMEAHKKTLVAVKKTAIENKRKRKSPSDDQELFDMVSDVILREKKKNGRDVIYEASLAHKEKRQRQRQKQGGEMKLPSTSDKSSVKLTSTNNGSASSKKQPPLTKPTTTAENQPDPEYEAKKDTLRNVIKEEITRQNLSNNGYLLQQVYSGVKYSYRYILKYAEPLDLTKLRYIAKMYVDFYTNMDNVAAL